MSDETADDLDFTVVDDHVDVLDFPKPAPIPTSPYASPDDDNKEIDPSDLGIVSMRMPADKELTKSGKRTKRPADDVAWEERTRIRRLPWAIAARELIGQIATKPDKVATRFKVDLATSAGYASAIYHPTREFIFPASVTHGPNYDKILEAFAPTYYRLPKGSRTLALRTKEDLIYAFHCAIGARQWKENEYYSSVSGRYFLLPDFVKADKLVEPINVPVMKEEPPELEELLVDGSEVVIKSPLGRRNNRNDKSEIEELEELECEY